MKNAFRFVLCALASLLLLSPAPSLPARAAGDTVKIDNPPFLPGESAAQCYADAVDNLNHGTWFERAIIQLKEAIRQDPNNESYHLALGCAYADRTASLGWALAWTQQLELDKKQYVQDMAAWQKAQATPSDPPNEQPEPTPPPRAIFMKDDGRTLSLTPAQTGQLMEQLCANALAEWKRAIALAPTMAERAQCEYVEGWGMLILEGYRAPQMNIMGYSPGTPVVLTGFPNYQNIIDAFQACTHDDPSKATYWQSLGDILGRPSDDPANDDNSPGSSHGGMPAYRRALSIDPNNALLYFYLSQYETNAHSDQARSDLEQAIRADSTNAFPMYLLAADILQRTTYAKTSANDFSENQKPIDEQEQFDRGLTQSLSKDDSAAADRVFFLLDQAAYAPRCAYPVYHPAVPKMLNAVYDYEFRIWFSLPAIGPLRELARALVGYADIAALQGDSSKAYDADCKIVAMGVKIIGDWPVHADRTSGHSSEMVNTGMYIVETGYKDMIRNAQQYGDPNQAQMYQQELDQFSAATEDYYAAMNSTDQLGVYSFY